MGDTFDERVKSATRLSVNLGLLKIGEKLDIRAVTLLIWNSKKHPEVVETISEILTSEVAKKEVFTGIELYLPQIAHMLIHLDVDWPNHVLEQFTYMVAQHSIHFALQMHWFLYASLQDYIPENPDGSKNSKQDPLLFMRCATLMHGLERAIVYGNVSSTTLEKRYHDGEITKEQLDSLRNLDRLDNAVQIAKFGEEEESEIKGRLKYLDDKKSGGLLGHKWKEMHMELKLNMLLFNKNPSDGLFRAIPLFDTTVVDPEDPEMTEEEAAVAKDANPKGYEHYFELHERSHDRIWKFRAVNKTQRKKWVRLLRQAATLPPAYEPAQITINELSTKQLDRFHFFRHQMSFVNDITGICDSLFDVAEEERKAKLEEQVAGLNLDGDIYHPLCKSADVFVQLIEGSPADCFPFKAKENVPCLLTFKVQKNSQGQDVANVLHDKFNDEAIAGFFDNISHNILAPMRSLIARDSEAATNLLIKRPSLWNEEEDITSLSAASQLPMIDDKLRFIVKTNDDLRQEAFTMQLITFLQEIWIRDGQALYVRPFQILPTSNKAGLVEFVPRSRSFHSLKKEFFDKHNADVPLVDAFKDTFLDDLKEAQRNFVESCAGYSVACYLFGIKNRHNGNIMLDNTGRVIHVDFGFVLGMAPGKNKILNLNFSVESAAFKMTSEMAEAMGGTDSKNYELFKELCVEGFMSARLESDKFVSLVEIMGYNSTLPCFNQPGGTENVLKDLRARFMMDKTDEEAETEWRKLIDNALGHRGTMTYETYQKTNGYYPLS